MAASTSETTCPTTGRYTTMRDSTQTGGVKQMSTAELDRIPVADSPEDVTNPSSANPLDSGWHPQPSDAAAGGPGW